jgi:hypothetical protein
MFDAVASHPRRAPWPVVVLSGTWAAAIATAPGISLKAALALPALLIPVVWWTLHRPERWLAAFFAAALLLPPLPIPIGNTGAHPSLVFAALGLLAGALWMGEWSFSRSALHGAMLLLFAALFASVAFAALDSGAALAAASMARVGLFGISVYVFFYTANGPASASDGWKGLRRIYWIAAGSALFACVDFYFQFPAPAGFGPQFVWLDSGVYRRAQGVFYEASTLGNFCAFFLVMTAVAFSRHRSEAPVGRKGLAAGGVVFVAALVLSYSRGSLVNLLVAMAVLAWRNRARIRLWRVAAFAGAAAFLTWQIFPRFAQAWWLRIFASAEYFFPATEGVLSGRLASWRALAAWVEAHPWQAFAGIGYKTLPYTDYLGSPLVADNMYFSMLVETGVLGLGALLLLHAAILRSADRASHSVNPRTAFLGTSMFCFWAGEIVQMASGDLLTYWRVLPVYFWVLALATRG